MSRRALCPRARDNFGTLWPLPEKTTCFETFFARTAWSQGKTQVLAKKYAKLVHAHSRKPHPNIVRKLGKCTPRTNFAQSQHIFGCAHLSHKFSGTCRECPRAQVNFAQFSRTHGLFSKSASVQAMNVSMLAPSLIDFRGNPGFWAFCTRQSGPQHSSPRARIFKKKTIPKTLFGLFLTFCLRVHAKGVVLCERACSCLLSAF